MDAQAFSSSCDEITEQVSKNFPVCVPGNIPGMRSWMTSRNAVLGDLQEHTPELAFRPFSGTVPECQVLQVDME